MEINVDKIKLMANVYGRTNPEIMVNGHTPQRVKEFSYMGSIVSDEGSKPEILARTAQVLSAIARLKPIWVDKGLKLMTKIRFMHSIIFSVFLYPCETWTLNTDLECRIWAMNMCCNRKILNISYRDNMPNEEVHHIISEAIGQHDNLLTITKKHKLRWYGHVIRSNGLAKTIMQGTVYGGRHRGRQRRRWDDNV